MHQILVNPYVQSALAGALAAAVVDLHAFFAWKSFHDVVEYSWATASFRWLQGAVAGVVTRLGLPV